MHYTDAEAEIIAKALASADWGGDPQAWDGLNETGHARYLADARPLLDAVVPALVARVLRDEAEFIDTLRHCTARDAAAYLNEYADEIEGK